MSNEIKIGELFATKTLTNTILAFQLGLSIGMSEQKVMEVFIEYGLDHAPKHLPKRSSGWSNTKDRELTLTSSCWEILKVSKDSCLLSFLVRDTYENIPISEKWYSERIKRHTYTILAGEHDAFDELAPWSFSLHFDEQTIISIESTLGYLHSILMDNAKQVIEQIVKA